MSQRIVRFFPDVDMRNGHDGLTELARSHKINVSDLVNGEYCLFLNRKLTHVKLFAPGNVIAHLKLPDNKKIDPSTIALIPRFFDGSKINYDKALSEAIRKKFKTDLI